MFSTNGVCAPSRSAIITGMYPNSIGSNHMRTVQAARAGSDLINYETVPPAAVKCFPEYLRAADYYCTNNNKTDYQFAAPFTAWDENGNKAHWRNRRDVALNYDNIMVMDSLVGTILRLLDDDKLLDHTIVIFFSDHGSGMALHKREIYDRRCAN